MKSKGIKALLGVIVCFIGVSTAVKAQHGYFYTGKNYGSEAAFSPLTQILNGGFDMIETADKSNYVADFHLGNGFRKVFYSLVHPREAIDQIGWKKFAESELIPFGFSKTSNQWIPNYGLHFIGGGMEYARLIDFYDYHGVKSPRVVAFFTALTDQLFNEAVEHNKKPWLSYDAVSDIYFFDIPGMILFSFEPVQRFFSQDLVLRSWLSQAAYVPTNQSLQNVGQYYSLKWKPSILKNTSVFWYLGSGWLFGGGYDHKGYTYSLGIGTITEEVIIVDNKTKQENITSKPSVGFFVDKNNSLMASIIFVGSKKYDENIKIEIFPGVIKTKKIKVGVWTNISFYNRSYMGITFGWMPSLGF